MVRKQLREGVTFPPPFSRYIKCVCGGGLPSSSLLGKTISPFRSGFQYLIAQSPGVSLP